MKIISLQAENFKRLSAVQITPTGNVVEISGKNGQGKSSVLDAIEAALAGGKHLPGVPIRRGEKTSRIKVEIGGEKVELVVTRHFEEGGAPSKLVVETATGARAQKPQSVMDALLGAMTFDPLEFIRGMKPQEQFTALRGMVNIDVDFAELDGLNRRDFDARTGAGREARAFRAQAEGIVVADGLPAEKIDTKPILDRLTSASDHNGNIEREALRRAGLLNEVKRDLDKAKELRDHAADLRRRAEIADGEAQGFETRAGERRDAVAALPEMATPIDATAVREELTAATATNEKIDRRERRSALIAQADAKDGEVEKLSDAIEARKEAKADAIRTAKFPVEGLGFGDDHVTFNGLPLDQASQAEQIRVSMAIAMAANPKLRVLRIKEGAFLDAEGMQLVANLAAQNDYQVWVERIDPTTTSGIIIEDGHVKAPAAVEPETVQPGLQL